MWFFHCFIFLPSGSFRASPKALQVTLCLQKQRRETVADYVLTLALMKVILSRWCLFNDSTDKLVFSRSWEWSGREGHGFTGQQVA